MDELDQLGTKCAEIDQATAPVSAETETKPAPGAAPESQAAALQEAAMICALAAEGVTALYPFLQYDQPTRDTAAAKLAPLLAKYGMGSGLFERWAVEIEAGLFFGALIFGGYRAVKAHKAAEKAAEAKATTDPQPGNVQE